MRPPLFGFAKERRLNADFDCRGRTHAGSAAQGDAGGGGLCRRPRDRWRGRSEEHTSELQSLMRISYAVFCLKKKKTNTQKVSNKKSIIKREIIQDQANNNR